MESEEDSSQQARLPIINQQMEEFEEEEATQEVNNKVGRSKARGPHAPELIINPVSYIYYRPIVTGVVTTCIPAIDYTIFLGKVGGNRVYLRYIWIVFH